MSQQFTNPTRVSDNTSNTINNNGRVDSPVCKSQDIPPADPEFRQQLKRPRTHSTDDLNGVLSNSVISDLPQWQNVLEKAITAIVSIRFCQVMAFDTEGPTSSEGTGFIVDAENGLILTNRHIVCSGPFVGEAIAHDHEEFEVYPVYRDPIHDFGFLKFNPKDIKYMHIHQIDLRPDLAKVGIDIRVVGNDAGEKLSILAGSISRINRNAPHYGELTYNDFNTFYLQAASSTSGGSSGSPVLNIDGHAVALQAGGRTEAATDFFLPLDRVKRALGYVQKSLTVPRGTIQTRFVHRPFDEARRLGLSSEFEDQIRRSYPDEIGTLVVEQVLPKGPAHGLIRESDILISINGNLVTKFVDLEEVLDSSIDGTITVVVDRGGKPHTVEVNIQDLHSITPNRLLEVGGAQLNDLSYQLACHYGQPVEGVYVSSASGIFKLGNSGLGAIITSVDDHPTPNLDTFIEVMKSIPDCKRFPVVYHSIADVHTTDWILTVMDRHWSSMTLYTKNDTTGIWESEKVGEYVEPLPLVPKTASFVDIETHSVPAQVLKHSVVRISYFTPVKIDGFPRSRTRGGGIILDAEKGLVVTSRNVIPFDIGDIYITFAESIVIPGKVEFLHPSYNFAILSYDPKFIGETPVKTPKISETRLSQGNSVYLVGFNQNFRVFATKTVVSDITNVTIPEDATPRFRSINLDTITLDTPLAHSSSTGILSDEEGNIQGLWLTFLGEKSSNHYDNEYHMGIHISTVLPALKSLQEGKFPLLYSLNVELSFVNLVQARHLELPEEWIARIENAGATERAVYQVRRTEVGSQSSQVLQTLDLILTLNGKILSKMSDIDELSHLPELDITILRGKKILDLKVKQDLVQGNGTDRIVIWAGTIIQAPHKAVLQQSTTLPSRVYISGKSTGGPGYHYGLDVTMWITHINDVSTPDLDTFIQAIKDLPDNTYVRVRVMSFDGIPGVFSIKTNYHYWPTTELVKDNSERFGWKKNRLNSTLMEED